jgi:hypothetical protein
MWNGFTAVGTGYDPIVSEGKVVVIVQALNAGPGVVELRAWNDSLAAASDPNRVPDYHLELRPGSTSTVSGQLIRLHLKRPTSPTPSDMASAAVGWRFLCCPNGQGGASP